MEKMSKIEEMQKSYSAYLEKVGLSSIVDPDELSSDSINFRSSILNELKNRISKKLQALDQAFHYYLFFGQNSAFDSNISQLASIDQFCFQIIQSLTNQIISSCTEENQEEDPVED